jgi:dTMP kinase
LFLIYVLFTIDFEDWWAKKQEKQAELADHDVPAYTKKEVDSKLKKIAKAFDKLKKMEKPKPKKEKKKKEKKKKKKDAPPAERPTLHEKDEDLASSKLEDQESIAARVTELTEKKKNAAAEEDFEEAGVLKERIDKLEELSKFLKDEAVRAEEEALAAAAEAEEKAKAEAEGGGEQPKTEGGEEPKPEGEAEAGAEGEETAQPEL